MNTSCNEPTTHVRLTMLHWDQINAALQYAAGDGLEVAPNLYDMFVNTPFKSSPPVLTMASTLVAEFVKCRHAPGPVTVIIDGPQASGKTLLRNAIVEALRCVEVPVHVLGYDPEQPGVTPTYIISDDVQETVDRLESMSARRRQREQNHLGLHIQPPPSILFRARFALGRLSAFLRGLRR